MGFTTILKINIYSLELFMKKLKTLIFILQQQIMLIHIYIYIYIPIYLDCKFHT